MKNTKNLLFLAVALLITSACNVQLTGLPEDGKGGGLDPKAVEKAENDNCLRGQTLQEYQGGSLRFGDLNSKSKVFAFSKPDGGSCLITQSINRSWTDQSGLALWFNLNPNSDCLKNHSIWVVENASYSNSGMYYSLRSVDDPNLPLVQMSGHIAVSAGEVMDLVGLKLLVCR